MGWGGPATSPHSPGPITHHQAEVSQPPTRPPRQSQEMTRLIHNWGLETAVLGPETCGALAVCSPDRIFRAMTEDDEGGMEASRSTTKIFVWGLGRQPSPLHTFPLPPSPSSRPDSAHSYPLANPPKAIRWHALCVTMSMVAEHDFQSSPPDEKSLWASVLRLSLPQQALTTKSEEAACPPPSSCQ